MCIGKIMYVKIFFEKERERERKRVRKRVIIKMISK